MSEWQPIETAPNGRILGWIGYPIFMSKDQDGRWCDDYGNLIEPHPTHWGALPEPPK